MAQRKRTGSAKRAGGASSETASEHQAEEDAGALSVVRDVFSRRILLTPDRLQETLDDAVRRGRMTRSDAEELLTSLMASGLRQTEELLADLENVLERSRGLAADAGRRVRERASQNTDRMRREVDRARRATGLSSFPIGGYDDLTAAQITTRLDELSAAELRHVREYERRHGNRKTVLAAIDRKLA
jgi:polyhydroxyalkanoate synthesis regulator phasin